MKKPAELFTLHRFRVALFSLTSLPHRDRVLGELKGQRGMKKPISRAIQIGTAAVVSCIVAYGVVYAQQACCGTVTDVCVAASNRAAVSYNVGDSGKSAPLRGPGENQRLSSICSDSYPADCSDANVCCETYRCDSHQQTKRFSLPYRQDPGPLNEHVTRFDSGNRVQITRETYGSQEAPDALRIYILTQSIIV